MSGEGADELPLGEVSVKEPARSSLSLKEQAEFVDDLVRLCTLRDGSFACNTLLCLTPEQASELRALGAQLHRIAVYEDEIRRLVTGR